MDLTETGIEGLPYDVEAEKAVISCILAHPEDITLALEYIKPESFFIENHQKLFAIMLSNFTIGKSIDIITVIDEAVKEKIFENSSEAKLKLADLVRDEMIFPKNLESYCKIVEEKFYTRQLITAAREIIESSVNEQGSATELLDLAEQKIYDIRQGKAAAGITPIKNALVDVYDELVKKSGPDRELYLGIKSGYNDLDSFIYGLKRSDLLILAARPAMGKSTLAMNIAANVAKRKDSPEVAVFSLEMSTEQLVTRMLSAESLVENKRLMRGDISNDLWKQLAEGADRLNQMNIYIDDTPGMSAVQMKAKLRRMKNLGLVIVDHIQLMSAGRRIDNRVNEMSEITRQLKLMAKEMNVPIIALSQLSRAVDSRTDKRPMLSDLRDSGSIEQDADIVMFLYRDGYYNKENPDTSSECIIAKNRHGETGTVRLQYNSQFTLFVGLDRSGISPD